MSASMAAWVVDRPGPVSTRPLRRVERPIPEPGPCEIRIRVSVCGVCRTDLHLAEGDLPARRPGVIPGHEVVGVVDAMGAEAARFAVGQRVGIAWLRWTCGQCRFCRRGAENLCVAPRFTGWDDDGGYAQYAVVDEAFAYALPEGLADAAAAPLLCAGIIGYRALRRSNLPRGGTLAIYGFGASAHLAAQVALREGATVFVMTRAASARHLATDLGAAWVGAVDEPPPRPADAAILFAPVGTLVIPALRALDRGGTLAVAGIHLSEIPALNYEQDLFQERTLCSVTANTRRDGEEFLAFVERSPLEVTAVPYGLEHADQALTDLAEDRVTGAAVIVVR